MRSWNKLLALGTVLVAIAASGAVADEVIAQKKEYIITTIKLNHVKPSELLHYQGWCGGKSESCRYCAQVQQAKADDSQPVSKLEGKVCLVRSITPVDFPEGIMQIAPFDLDTSMIVKGSPEGIEKLQFIISEADYERRQVAFAPSIIEITAEVMEQLTVKLPKDVLGQGDGSLVCVSASKTLLSGAGITLEKMNFSSGCAGVADDKMVTAFTLSGSPLLSEYDDSRTLADSNTNLQILPIINTDGSITANLLVHQRNSEKNHVGAKLALGKDDVILLFRNSRQKNVLVVLVPKVMDEK